MLGRGRASVRCKATWLHPEQQECMGATISRHTFKCASFKKKKEQKGNAKVSATKWLLSRVRISLERLFWALAWSSPEVLCINTLSPGLNWKAQSSALCSGAFGSAGPRSLAMRPWGQRAHWSRVSPAMMHRTWSLGQSSVFSGKAPHPPASSYRNDGLAACPPTWYEAAPQKINKLKRKLFRAAFPSGFSAKQFNCS